MLEGVNGDEFGSLGLTNSAHTFMATCTTCHMADGPAEGNPGAGKVGGHTFNMMVHAPDGFCTGGIDNGEPCTADADCDDLQVDDGAGTCTPSDPDDGFENHGACNSIACHGSSPLTTFNRLAWADYDNDGTTEGVQDEIQGLLDLVLVEIEALGAVKLGGYPYWSLAGLDPAGFCDGGIDDGQPCVADADCDDLVLDDAAGSCMPADEPLVRSAIWNYEYVDNDASLGIHNTDYAGGLLQLTYEKLTGAPLPTNLLYTP